MSQKELMEELFTVLHTIKKKMYTDRVNKKHPSITLAQSRILFLIAEQTDMSVKQLANTLQTTSSAITQLIDGLVAQNYVQRTESELDRRMLLISLTPHGEVELKQIKQERLAYFSSLLSCLSAEELETYVKINQKIVRSFNN